MSFVEYAIPPSLALGAGVVAALIGFRKRKVEANGTPNRWGAKYAKFFKVGGPLLLVAAVVWVLVAPRPDGWRRHLTADGACSAEFPQAPAYETDDDADRLTVALPDRNANYSLTFSDVSPETAALPPDKQFELLRDIFASKKSPGGAPPRLVKELVIADHGIAGREYQFAVGDMLVTRIRVFVVGPRIYRAIAVYPPDAKLDRDAQRFVGSFRFENVKP